MAFDTTIVSGGAHRITAELHSPVGTAATGLVVVVYGADGFIDNDRGLWQTMVRGYAEALAARGLFALIPDYFASTGTSHGGAALDLIGTHRDQWAAALLDAVSHARTLPRVDEARVGLLGFSLGGHLCLRIRAAARAKALVEYFAPVFDGIGPAGHVPQAQIHHGTDDEFPATKFVNAGVIESVLKAEGTAVTTFPYKGAKHGFAGKDVANVSAAASSKGTTLAFLNAHL